MMLSFQTCHESFFQDQKKILDYASIVHNVSLEVEPEECISHFAFKIELAVISIQ